MAATSWILAVATLGLCGCQARGLEPALHLAGQLEREDGPRPIEPVGLPDGLAAAAVHGAPVPLLASSGPMAAPESCQTAPAPEPAVLPASVTFGDFFAALAVELDQLDTSALEPSFEDFARRHAVQPTPELRRDFLRLWAVFEATRDGGWWRLRWQVTDQEPSSLQIWRAWERKPPTASFAAPSAVAECDEITALFAVTARRLGVRGVGLFYPTWNHVIAGWSRPSSDGKAPHDVVLIPTTQIYQSCEASFDATTFKPPKQVYEFPRYDVRDSREMSRELAEFLLAQVRAYGDASPELLALIRTKRAELLRSSLGNCQDYRARLVQELRTRLTCADRRALRHLARAELEQPSWDEAAVLSFLADGRSEP